jgi:hypothetical protein
VISLEEFREGCRLLNRNLHPDYQLTNVEHTLKLMDFDGSGTIDINEFFEVRTSLLCAILASFVHEGLLNLCAHDGWFEQTFRILDGKDGKVDGVLSIAKREGPVVARTEMSVKAKAALD